MAVNSELSYITELAQSPSFTTVPNSYAYFTTADDPIELAVDHLDHSGHHETIPVIDLSLLQFGTPDQRSQIARDLDKACQDWGFFMVVNHGVPDSLIRAMFEKCDEFFKLPPDERREFAGKHVLDPIRCGTSFNTSVEDIHCWRDFLKVLVHPNFHCPTKPHGFSDIASEYVTQIRRIARVLLGGVFSNLGLNEDNLQRSLNLERSQQVLVANYYPPCPEPNVAIGIPPHSDHGLFTVLAQNQVGGLQILHNDKWIPVHALPNSLLINTGDHIEIFSNGRYKSVLHRATVNNKATRISIVITNGPSLDTVVSPASQVINDEEHESGKYKPMLYKEYLQLQQSRPLDGKSGLDVVRV